MDYCLNCAKKLTKDQIRRKKKYCSPGCGSQHAGPKGEKSYWYGKELAEETKKKISAANTKTDDEKIKHKNICALCGKEFYHRRKKPKKYCSEECYKKSKTKRKKCPVCGKLVKRAKRVYCSAECRGVAVRKDRPKCLICGNECKHAYSKTCSRECDSERRRLERVKFVKQQLTDGQVVSPFYNKKACKWFEDFDNENNTRGQHAETPQGERHIKGYWLDYINDDMKIIIEWNEKHHYKKDGSLRAKDARKRDNILEEYKDYSYWIIKEDTMEINKYSR